MPTTVQFRRGSTANNDSFTGATGELSIDSTLNEIRVHDGSTAGGFTTARKTELSKMMSVANTQALFSSVSANSTTINTKMAVSNVTALFVTSDASIATKMAVSNVTSLFTTSDASIATKMAVSNVTARFVTSDASIATKMAVSNVTSLFTTSDATTATKMAVSNVTSLFTTSDASIATKMAVANTTLLVNDRLQVANATTSFALKADLASPTLTGTPVAPTAANTTNTTQIATTAFVQTAIDLDIAALANSAPVTLNTLNELAAALGDDANFAATLTTNLGQKLGAAASVALTGDVSGTANFSSNAVSITTVIADDSHNHVVSNVDGLQTELDTKSTWSGLTGTNTAIRTLVSDRVQVANNNTLLGAKATWSALTSTNNSIRLAISADATALSIALG